MRRLGLALLVPACAGPSVVGPYAPADLPDEPPDIVEATLTCDAEDGRWKLVVTTDAWSGGGITFWTTDGVYVETHRIQSVKAAADASADELLLELNVVADWRMAAPGARTAFTCASRPDVVFWLFDQEGKRAGPCRSWGPDPAIWEQVSGVQPCPG